MSFTTSGPTIGNLKRVQADQLREWLLDPKKAPEVGIIDVRDDDHVGGHIKTSTHVPSSSLDYRVPEIVRKMADKEIVVFHCALSQQRGPSAALRYLRERQAKSEKGDFNTAHEFEQVSENAKPEQQVYVLDQGFVGWVKKKYGTDERLTEAFAADIWEDYD